MRKWITLSLAMVATSASAHNMILDDAELEGCTQIEGLAELAMTNRQTDESYSTVYRDIIKKYPETMANIGILILDDAYDSIVAPKGFKQGYIEDFKTKWFKECIKQMKKA